MSVVIDMKTFPEYQNFSWQILKEKKHTDTDTQIHIYVREKRKIIDIFYWFINYHFSWL